MAQSLDGADGLPTGRPESPLHLLEDETAPDDAGEAGAGRKRKGKSTRWNIPSSALSMLEQMFQKDKFPSVETRKKIATDLKVTPRQVQVWFQNKRQRSTKPPGRPSDTRSILNTSEDIQAALINFGIGVTCGFGQPGVDPTLGQLEVFANEDANGRVGSNLAQAAMLNFGNGLNAGYGNGADAGLLEGGYGREEGGSRNPRLPAGRANTQLTTTEAWMAAAAAQMASLAAANSIANAAAESSKLAESSGVTRAAAPAQGLPQAAGVGGVNWWCPGGSGQPSSSSQSGMPWGMLPPNFGGSASSSLLSALPPAAISQMLSGGAALPGGPMSRSISSDSFQGRLSASDHLPGCGSSTPTDSGPALDSGEVKHEVAEAPLTLPASTSTALREAGLGLGEEGAEATDDASSKLFLQLADASGGDSAPRELGEDGEPPLPAPAADEGEAATLSALLASKATSGPSGATAATAATLAASNPTEALSALAAGDGTGQLSESARLMLIKHWQQHHERQQLALQQQAQQATQHAQHQLSQLSQAGEEGASASTDAPPAEPVKEEEGEPATAEAAAKAAGEAEGGEASTDELSLQKAQQQLQIQRQQLQRQQMQQQQLMQHQQLLQRQQQAQQHSQLVAAQQILQHQQVQHQQQQVRAQAARRHLQQQAAQHLQQARAQAQAQALSQALTQAQSQQSQYGHASAQVAQAQAMHEAKRRGGLQAGGPSQEAHEGGQHAEGQGKQKRGRRRSKAALNEGASPRAAAGPSAAGQGQPGDDLMDELIESLFTEELGTIRYQQQGALGQAELPATPVAQEATSPPPEIASSLSLSSSAGGNSRKRSSPSSDDNLSGNDILQFEYDDALLLDV